MGLAQLMIQIIEKCLMCMLIKEKNEWCERCDTVNVMIGIDR